MTQESVPSHAQKKCSRYSLQSYKITMIRLSVLTSEVRKTSNLIEVSQQLTASYTRTEVLSSNYSKSYSQVAFQLSRFDLQFSWSTFSTKCHISITTHFDTIDLYTHIHQIKTFGQKKELWQCLMITVNENDILLIQILDFVAWKDCRIPAQLHQRNVNLVNSQTKGRITAFFFRNAAEIVL